MNTVLLGVITVILLVVAGSLIYLVFLLAEMRKAIVSIAKTARENLRPSLEELNLTLKSMRTITDNVGEVTEDIKELSHSVRQVGKTIGAVNLLVGNLGASTAVKAVSMRAGIRAGVEYLFAHILRKGERK